MADQVKTAIDVIENYFDEFTKKHYEKIQSGLNLDDDGIKDVINQIIKLNPKPGGQVGETNKLQSYVIPDFFVMNNNGKLEVTLNSKNAPDLTHQRRIQGHAQEIMTRDQKKISGKKKQYFLSSKK